MYTPITKYDDDDVKWWQKNMVHLYVSGSQTEEKIRFDFVFEGMKYT